MTMDFKMRPWLMWVLIFVVAGVVGYFVWYFTVNKSTAISTTTPSQTIPTPTPSVTISNSNSNTNNDNSTQPSDNSSLNVDNNTDTNTINFEIFPIDSQWPNPAKISLNPLTYLYDSSSSSLKSGSSTAIFFSGDVSYYPSTDIISRARDNINILTRNRTIANASDPISMSIDGNQAAKYTWNKANGYRGATIIVHLFSGAQLQLKIDGNFNTIPESDFNKIIDSIKIQK